MLLEKKRIVVTGVLTESSIAYSVARLAQEQGAELVLTSFGRAMRLTQRCARRLPEPPDVLELDVTDEAHLETLTATLGERWDRVDGVVHAVAFAPETCLGGDFLGAGWDDVSRALHVSAYSKHEDAGSSGGELFFPVYGSGPRRLHGLLAEAGVEKRGGPRGVRVNLVCAGPLRTVAARAIPGFAAFEDAWDGRAPLGWNVDDPEPAARACVALLSDWLPATTGEKLHVDGGYHAMGA